MRRIQNDSDSKYAVGRQEVWRRKATSWRKPTDFSSFKDRRGAEIRGSWRGHFSMETVEKKTLCALAPEFVPAKVTDKVTQVQTADPAPVLTPKLAPKVAPSNTKPTVKVAPTSKVAKMVKPVAKPAKVIQDVTKPVATDGVHAYTIWFSFFVALLSIATGMYAATNAEEGFKMALFAKLTIFEVAALWLVYPMVRHFGTRHSVKTVEDFGEEETVTVG